VVTVALCAVVALVLAACGGSSGSSSGGSTITVGAESAAASAATTTASSATVVTSSASSSATDYPAGCHAVKAPAPRAVPHLHKPTLRLDSARSYTVSLQTNCGRIEIALAVKQAPKTSASFAYLVRLGFFNGLTFHRIAAGFVIQGGDPLGNGSGGPGYEVVEAPPANLRYTVGTVAMAKTSTDPNGASGSQFFIVTGAEGATLPAQYALLGHVVAGMKAVDAIAKIASNPPGDGTPVVPVVISRASLSDRG
jgi:peptidyl-prolyl cis-trans isomerase B (cyclophilin B)